jgi:hypothetical protein
VHSALDVPTGPFSTNGVEAVGIDINEDFFEVLEDAQQ